MWFVSGTPQNVSHTGLGHIPIIDICIVPDCVSHSQHMMQDWSDWSGLRWEQLWMLSKVPCAGLKKKQSAKDATSG